ncbi:MAG: hypothetical protein PHH54_04185 [Candidatus Nanoarchaeia archaeon]|nr:hypothetical protein [Candidatus Nanoarchaeia archaeon]MDD5741159.1 hypothetical protein [Candidatus Nanoarchaeia archaeon]
MKNKKADIAITILVTGVIALCILALLIFYVSEKRQESEGINSFFYLQEVYNQAESARYSGEDNIDNYENVRYDSGFVVEKEFLDGNLKVRYTLNP